MSGASKIGLEKRDGYDVGRDPREMSVAEFSEAGHDRISRGKAMRIKCLDCCGDSANEVRLCVAVDCALWPFRMGTDPWRAPVSDAQREHSRKLGLKRAAERSTPLNGNGNQSALPVQAPTLPNGIPAEKSKENRWGTPEGAK